ncbi:MAG: glutathione-dependent formaldehyde-activating [Beijerinckiaceae bacterium]|nr:MAG: glutathione-dependent formaldehyde-activating [Beijerinckiaceae bacterium]
MTAASHRLTGGCQCGAVRFACEGLTRPSICHCRMCQKAFGAPFGALVNAETVVWTRGAPKHFQSSNKVRRGFCGECGTPLTYEDGGLVNLSICAFDDPAVVAPVIQLATESRIPWCDGLSALPVRSAAQEVASAAFVSDLVSFQHPDHDTTLWPPAGEGA